MGSEESAGEEVGRGRTRADPVGGCNPPLIFQKNSGHPRGRCDRFTRVAVVIDLVVTSSNNACLCALNSVAV